MNYKSDKYIWLFSENLSETMNNNSFYFWKYIINRNKDSDIDCYYIAKRNRKNKEKYLLLSEEEKRKVIWRNSASHLRLFFLADMYFVSLSFRDVQPDRILFKSYKPNIQKPLIYLQHGTSAIKRLYYQNNYANNSLLRFVYYNPEMKEKFIEMNGFKNYQLMYSQFHPRYIEMVRKDRTYSNNRKKNILWFLTWREYFSDEEKRDWFNKEIESILCDPRLSNYLKENDSTLTLCTHSFYKSADFLKALNNPNIRMVKASSIDLMDLMAECSLMITDYSSLGFDFTLLNRPVILYQNDLEFYSENRDFYCSVDEMKENAVQDKDSLVDMIVNEKYGINPFFRNRIPEKIDYDAIIRGEHIEKLFQQLSEMERNSIAFIGYDFSGIGGTVFATNAMAEGLMEKGYLVRYLTLKRVKRGNYPTGVAVYPMYDRYNRKKIDYLKLLLFSWKHFYYHLKNDPAKEALRPFAGFGMKFWMDHLHIRTVISTRESLHLFLRDAKSPFIKNRIYYFHTSAEIVDDLFPGVIKRLTESDLEKAVFVTKNNKEELESRFGFNTYKKSAVIGNSIPSYRSLSEDQIEICDDMICLKGAYLLRISEDKKEDIDDAIKYAEYLKEKGIEDIKIDVYGSGDYVERFINMIEENGLENYIFYKNATDDIVSVMKEHSFIIDFSYRQSFGMSYIEAVFNGRPVFCRHNKGSDEVLSGFPECFYTDYDELTEKIHSVRSITVDELKNRYRILGRIYSRDIIAQQLLDFINE